MKSDPALRRFVLVFGIAFAVLYVVALAGDLALFTVYPSLGVVLFGTHRSKDVVDPAMGFLAPAMYWYGWTATTILVSGVLGILATFLPQSVVRKIPLSLVWIMPLVAVPILVYALRFFWRW
jgi:amino acid permease